MRNFINILAESHQNTPLYHGTSLSSALEMLRLDTMHAGSSLTHEYRIANFFAEKTCEKLSDNYSYDATSFPLGRLEFEADLGTCCIFSFDQAKLAGSIGLEPVSDDDNGVVFGIYGEEFEERPMRDIKPLSTYLVAAEADGFEEFAALVAERLPQYRGALEKMRSLLGSRAITESADHETFIDAHLVGPDTVEIEMMVVPQSQRKVGAGRAYYQQWEDELPSNVKLVQLWCADADGTGKANGFWEAMGFDYKYTGEPANDDDEIWWWMWKGVNGHLTPPSIPVDDDDDA